MTSEYFLIDMTDAGYSDFIQAAEDLHKSVLPNNNLSVVVNDNETKSLVKISGVTDQWKTDHASGSVVIESYTEESHDGVMAVLSGDEWSNTRGDE